MKLTNPYAHLVGPDAQRTSLETSREDWGLIKGVHGRAATLQNTLNTIVQRLAEHLRKNNITSYDPAEYERVIDSITFNYPSPRDFAVGCTTHERADGTQLVAPIQAVEGNDQRRADVVALPPAGDPAVPSNPDKSPAKKRAVSKKAKANAKP